MKVCSLHSILIGDAATHSRFPEHRRWNMNLCISPLPMGIFSLSTFSGMLRLVRRPRVFRPRGRWQGMSTYDQVSGRKLRVKCGRSYLISEGCIGLYLAENIHRIRALVTRFYCTHQLLYRTIIRWLVAVKIPVYIFQGGKIVSARFSPTTLWHNVRGDSRGLLC